LVLTTHITASVGWIGAGAAFLVLSIAAVTSRDPEVVRGAYLSMNLICLYIIVPLSLAALATGLIQALGTQWGLFRHYWILIKFLLTILSITVLLMHQSVVAEGARLVSATAAAALPTAELGWVGFELVRASGLGILVLLAAATLSVYKPWGRTRYGRRMQHERQCQPARSPQTVGPMATSDPKNPTMGEGLPRGLKIFLAAGISVFVLVELLSLLFSGHSLHHGH
jgi:hypothetical protein